MTLLPRLSAFALFGALWMGAPCATAEDAADKIAARNLAREAQTALMNHDFEAAAERFDQARRLVDAPTLHVGYARARAGQKRYVEAFEAYRVVISRGVAADASAPFKQAFATAEKESAEVEKRLAWIEVSIDGVEGGDAVEVKINGRLVADAALATPRPVDPGPLWVSVSAKGYAGGATKEMQAAEGQRDLRVEFALEKLPESAPVAAPPIAAVAPAPPAPGRLEQVREEWQELGAWLSLGVGALGVGVGITGTAIALDSKSALDGQCVPIAGEPGVCPAASDGTVSTFYTSGDIATIGFVTGGVFLAAGGFLWFTSPERERQTARRSGGIVSLRPLLSPGGIGVRGAF